MNPRNSLRRRIALAYLLFASVSTLLFALIATTAVEGIEEHLVDNRLKEVAAWAAPRAAGGMPVAMPTGLSFYHGSAIPASLRQLKAGISEVTVEGVSLHVLSERDTRGPFVVVDHESDYHKVELVVYSMFALAFAVMLTCAMLLGRFIGSRIVAPIKTLVRVAQGGPEPVKLLQRRDELGDLARAWVAHSSELRGYLERERHFTGDISHELRTPLTVISGAAEVLICQAEHNPAVRAPAERILRAANDASSCIGVLLMLARSPERVSHQRIDAALVARQETDRYQPMVSAKQVALHFAGGAPVFVDAPAELCAALIGNLVRNACQYTDNGTVIVRTEGQTVIVEDTGPGLPPSALAALAGHAVAQRAAPGEGAGLGLALVRRICAYLGITLDVVARDEGGTRVSVHFNRA